MERFGGTLSEYNLFNEDVNRIEAEGCQHLARADWKHLKTLNLRRIRLM